MFANHIITGLTFKQGNLKGSTKNRIPCLYEKGDWGTHVKLHLPPLSALLNPCPISLFDFLLNFPSTVVRESLTENINSSDQAASNA